MDLALLDDLKERLNIKGMGKPALVGVAVVLVVVTAIVAWRLVGTAAASEFQVASGSTAAEASVPAVAEPETLFVHVSGEVMEPGLCEVGKGARVAAAIEAAGGFTDEAATDSVNLAREVSDGEQIVVGRKLSDEEVAAASAVPASGQPAGSSSAAPASSVSGVVNINTASEAELKSLPGIGDATAAKIIADRQANGPFRVIEDLKRVSGVGDKKYESICGLICV